MLQSPPLSQVVRRFLSVRPWEVGRIPRGLCPLGMSAPPTVTWRMWGGEPAGGARTLGAWDLPPSVTPDLGGFAPSNLIPGLLKLCSWGQQWGGTLLRNRGADSVPWSRRDTYWSVPSGSPRGLESSLGRARPPVTADTPHSLAHCRSRAGCCFGIGCPEPSPARLPSGRPKP